MFRAVSGAGRGARMLVPVALVVSLLVELAIAESRRSLLGRDPLNFRAVDSLPELALFGLALVAAQYLILLAFRLISAALFARSDPRRSRLFFLFWVIIGLGFVIAAKLRLEIALGETVGFALLRDLGGGSLAQAFSYVAFEAAPFLAAVAASFVIWLLLDRALARRGGHVPGGGSPPFRSWAGAAAAGLAAALLILAAGRTGDTRSALDRFVAPWLVAHALDATTDFDRDGFSWFSVNRDSHPLDPGRHPFALDIPGNGIDEDGFGGDLATFPVEAEPPPPHFPGKRLHVVVVVLETTRGEALGKRWNGRRVMPNLAAIAASGSAAPEAYSHASLTVHALKTLWTGRLAPPGSGAPSLFADFKRAGYRVAILSGQSEDFGNIAAETRMRENVDIFADASSLGGAAIWGAHKSGITRMADGRLLLREMDRRLGDRRGWRQPTFAYINIQASHFPYAFPGTPDLLGVKPIPRDRVTKANRAWVEANYWNGVAYSDWLVGRIAARLRALGVYDRTLMLVLGDHGEELFENGYIGHGQSLNRLQTHIPLVVNRPGIALPRPLGIVDARSILLRAAGFEVPRRPHDGAPVLQHTGTWARPLTIAMVERGGRWTRLDLATELVSSSDHDTLFPWRGLKPGSAMGTRARRLVTLWGRARWREHLAAATDARWARLKSLTDQR